MKSAANAAASRFGPARSLACIVLSAAAVLFAARGAAEQVVTGGKVRLAIGEFTMLSGDARFDSLRRGIPEILGAALLSDAGLVLTGPETLSAKLGRRGPSARSQLLERGRAGELARDFDYVLQGSYFEFEGKLVVSVSLLATRDDREVKLGQVTLDERRIVPGIESMAASVLAALRKQGAGGSTRSFAVSCFEDRSSPATEVSKLAKRDMALFLLGQLGARRGAQVVEWSRVESSCDSPPRDSAMARQLDVDAVISGWFKVENDTLYIVPALYVSDDGVRFDMPSVAGPVAQYLQLKVELGRKVGAVLDGALGSDGKWRVAELARTTRPEDNLSRGLELYKKGDLNLAALYLERAVASGSVPDALYYLGALQLDQKKFDEAAGNLERYVRLYPASGPAQRELGRAYAGLRKYDAAMAAYQRALEATPSLSGLQVDIGNVYFSQRKYDDAGRYYRKAIELAPDDLAAHFNLGLVAERQGNEDEAIRSYGNALRINAQDADAQQRLADLHHKRGNEAYDKGDYARAIREYDEEIAYRPAAPGYFNRGVAREYFALKQSKPDYSEAIRDYREAIKRGVGVPAHARYYMSSMLNLAEVSILSERYSDARDVSEQALKSSNEDPHDRQISRYLLVASRILLGADHTLDLALLRRDMASSKGKVDDWDFDPLDKFYKENRSIGEPQRQLLLQITDEFQKAASAQGK